jgi:hypothetical protein
MDIGMVDQVVGCASSFPDEPWLEAREKILRLEELGKSVVVGFSYSLQGEKVSEIGRYEEAEFLCLFGLTTGITIASF